MSGKVAKKAPKRKAANKYKLPDPIPAGEVLSDLMKKQWIIGNSIGVGGFGEIYAAAPYHGSTPKEYPNVIKIEPHGNGPLFVEINFYIRNAKPQEIARWKTGKKLSALGMPRYIASGSHECNNTKYRFIVMDRYGVDLWKLFEQNGKKFPEHTVYRIALQIIDILEYIHSRKYVHADIKGANLLLDLKTQDQVYLVDFGLATLYTKKPKYEFDAKRAHNGTIEYTSRDAHMGVPTMRGDFEILGYNIIHWLCGSLPWEKNLTNTTAVQNQKEEAMSNLSAFLDKCFHGSTPKPVYKYMSLVANMKFDDTPNYEKFKEIFRDGLKQLNQKPTGKLEFKNVDAIKHVATSKQVAATKQGAAKVTPQKMKKVTETRKSPRNRINNFGKNYDLNDSNVGVIIDQKRAGMKDIKKALDSIESDEEYDVMIIKKRKTKKPEEAAKSKVSERSKRERKVQRYNESENDSEPEVISKGTRSRPINSPRAVKGTRKKVIDETASDEDMFD